MTEEIKTEETIAKETSEENTSAEETAAEEEASADNRTGKDKKKKKKKKKPLLSENKIEIIVAVLLGITALLTAWATWIGSLHGGNQATNYTKSNNLASEGNSEYNAGFQLYLSDLMAWNTMMDYSFDLSLAEAEKDQVKTDLINEKLENYIQQNASQILLDGIAWMTKNNDISPFNMPGIVDQYFVKANELLEQSREVLEEGQRDNAKGDAYNLVNVVYSLVLFLLGIVGIFKGLPNRTAVMIIAAVGLILATVYMCTIPMPTGFDFASFFAPK